MEVNGYHDRMVLHGGEWLSWQDGITWTGMVVMAGWYTMEGNGCHDRMVLHGGEWLSCQDGILWRRMVVMSGWYYLALV